MIYRKPSLGSARKRTQIGLMISFSVITTRLWYLHRRMEREGLESSRDNTRRPHDDRIS